MIVYILPSNAKTLQVYIAIRSVPNFVYIQRLSSSSNVNIAEWLVSMPVVRLFLGSTLTISFGIACRGCTFDRSAFVLFQKV